jgi:hypothetical protein
MIYKELLSELQKLNEEQLNQDVCIRDCWGCGAYYHKSVEFVFATDAQDFLDVNHPIIQY